MERAIVAVGLLTILIFVVSWASKRQTRSDDFSSQDVVTPDRYRSSAPTGQARTCCLDPRLFVVNGGKRLLR
jgi:hypothetical protein